MSASREKKERQGVVAQGLTQKQLKEAKEAQAAKRKTVIYWIIGIISVVLVAALLIWNSGFFDKRATAATIGSENLTVADMQYYYNIVRNNELNQQQMYSMYGISMLSDPYVAYDFNSTDGDKQVYNKETNQTYADHFRESALTAAKEIVSLTAAANADGFTLSAAGKAQVEATMKSMKEAAAKYNYPSVGSYIKAAYGLYVDTALFKTHQTNATLASEYQTSKQDSLTYTTSQLSAYQQENPALLNSYDFRYAFIDGNPPAKTDDDGNTIAATDEEKAAASAAAKAKADALVKGVQDTKGDKSDAFNTLVKDAVGETSSSADPDSNLQSGVLGNDISSSAYFEWLSDASRKAGDISAIQSGSSYYVVLFLNSELSEVPTVDVRHILIKAETPVDNAETADVDESKGMPTQEALDAAKAEAQALLDEFNALPDDKRTAAAFGELANKHSDDGGSNTKGGLYRYVEQGDMVPEFDAWIYDASRKSGDTGLVANVAEGSSYYGYHVMYFVGQDGPKWHELAENALKSDDMTKWLETLQEPYTATWTETGTASVGR